MNTHKFNKELISELRRLPIFSKYWSNDLCEIVPENFGLKYVPSETISFYKAEFMVELLPIVDFSELKDTKAKFELLLTSDKSSIELEQVLHVDNQKPGQVHAANINVRVWDPNHCSLAELQKTLWSSAPARVSGDPAYVKLLI